MSKICDDLRAAILQAAMQGKLTEQLPEDGDAEDLLEDIKAEKERLITEGKIKKQKPLAPITDDEIPFGIPENWKWVRFGDISTYREPKIKYKKDEAKDVWLLELEDIERGGRLINRKIVQSSSIKGEHSSFKKGDILYSKLRPYLLKVLVAPDDGACTTELVPFDMYGDINSEYVVFFLKSPEIDKKVNGESYGQKMPRVNSGTIANLLFPLPPLAEQRRIVEKVDELMARVADLEQSADALASLRKAFPDDIKASLLQAAMQGKLTKQLLKDGSTEDMLEEIKTDKEKLIAEGKIKKQKPLAPITDDEIPFSIPENWKWVRLSELFQFVNGDRGKNYPSKNKLHASGEIPFISAINMQNGTVREDNLLYADRPTYDRLGSGKLNKDDFVICIRGSLGKYCKYPYEIGAIASSLVIARKYSEFIFDDYFDAYLQSPLLYNEIHEKDNGTAQPNLSAADLMNFLIPLPPFAEQKRISEHLNTFMRNINVVGELIASE